MPRSAGPLVSRTADPHLPRVVGRTTGSLLSRTWSLLSQAGAATKDLLAKLTTTIHMRHRWTSVESIGHVVTQRCDTCDKTRVRVRATQHSNKQRNP
ncbi:hypothetical protein GCM10022226_47540 [Sphaerisporangium flaviroseum]|uniref:Uncharacterized protein n=1 Tax=Sphaerisporangium flaviroseum TaxID=509199 RepID=A0ABP7ILX6_9ACTN